MTPNEEQMAHIASQDPNQKGFAQDQPKPILDILREIAEADGRFIGMWEGVVGDQYYRLRRLKTKAQVLVDPRHSVSVVEDQGLLDWIMREYGVEISLDGGVWFAYDQSALFDTNGTSPIEAALRWLHAHLTKEAQS